MRRVVDDGPSRGDRSWTATVSPAISTLTWPDGIASTLTRLPMQRRGTENSRPRQRTSIVGGTAWTETSATIDSKSPMLPTLRSSSFSRMNSTAGGTPVDALGSVLHRASMRAMAATSPSSPRKSPS